MGPSSPASECSVSATEQCPALAGRQRLGSASISESSSPEPAAATVCIVPPPPPTYIPSVFQFPVGKKHQHPAATDRSASRHAPYPTLSDKLSPAQMAALEHAFAMNQAPVTKEYTLLAQELGMTRADVMTWFRRKRVETPNDVRAVMQQLKVRERKQQEESMRIRRDCEERPQAGRIQISALLL
ncbi:hypothetical protein HDU82_004476 [Entophlyctis luteolus]|nr:hypothetical protein HDU82_004476 [Entophlyctis luteolus]KAJ3383389.1 hypothetical protein HDU84_003633 [Entophlyctis sp. JEL0112]